MNISDNHLLYRLNVTKDRLRYSSKNCFLRFILLPLNLNESVDITFSEVKSFNLSINWLGLVMSLSLYDLNNTEASKGKLVRLWLPYDPDLVKSLFKVLNKDTLHGYLRLL